MSLAAWEKDGRMPVAHLHLTKRYWEGHGVGDGAMSVACRTGFGVASRLRLFDRGGNGDGGEEGDEGSGR